MSRSTMILPSPSAAFSSLAPNCCYSAREGWGAAGGNLAQDADDYSDPSCNNCHIPSLPPAAPHGYWPTGALLLSQDKLGPNIKIIRHNE